MTSKAVNYAHRGKSLQTLIDTANNQYYYLGHGLIQFIETPMRQQRVGRTTKWVFAKKSTVDYVGTLKGGHSIAFEAKQTKLKSRFDFSNIGFHQMEHLKMQEQLGGSAFLIIEFTAHNKIFYVKYKDIAPHYYAAQEDLDAKKSLRYEWFIETCQQIRQGRGVCLDYLKYVNAS